MLGNIAYITDAIRNTQHFLKVLKERVYAQENVVSNIARPKCNLKAD